LLLKNNLPMKIVISVIIVSYSAKPFLINLLEIALFLVLMKPKVSLCYLRAYGWNFRNIKSALNKRAWIQNHRIVPDRKILNQMVKIPSKLYLLG